MDRLSRAASDRLNFTRVVLLKDFEFQEVDEGAKGRSLGDQLLFSGPLRNKKGKGDWGRLDGYCTITSNPGGAQEDRELCVITATGLPAGDAPGAELEMQGVGRVEAEDVDLGITGGTGVYETAHGVATFDFTTQGRVVITFHVIK
jgi:hypothetical protein